MNKKKISQIIKTVVSNNNVIPITQSVCLQGDKLVVTDLEISVEIPYKTGVHLAVPSKEFLTAFELMEAPEITVEYTVGITFTQGKKKIKVTGEEAENFPLCISSHAAEFNPAGSLTQFDIDTIETAMKFVGKDEFRPAMCGVFLGKKHIVSTDAHRLFFKPRNEASEYEIIIPIKAAKLLTIIGGDWSIQYNLTHAIFFNQVLGYTVYVHLIDAKFPEYINIIPQGRGNCLMSANIKELKEELTTAIKFANKTTSQVTFDLTGTEVTLNSQDVDFGYEYDTVIESAKLVKNGSGYKIAYNAKFLLQILGELDNNKPAKLIAWSPKKATIINEHYLIMPLMIQQ